MEIGIDIMKQSIDEMMEDEQEVIVKEEVLDDRDEIVVKE